MNLILKRLNYFSINKSNKSFDPMDVGNEKVIKECSGPFIDKMIITVVDFMLGLIPF